MTALARQLWRDEAGFIVSAELVLIATLVVIGLIVGLSEIATAVNSELNDAGNAFGSVNQSFRYGGQGAQNGGSEFRELAR